MAAANNGVRSWKLSDKDNKECALYLHPDGNFQLVYIHTTFCGHGDSTWPVGAWALYIFVASWFVSTFTSLSLMTESNHTKSGTYVQDAPNKFTLTTTNETHDLFKIKCPGGVEVLHVRVENDEASGASFVSIDESFWVTFEDEAHRHTAVHRLPGCNTDPCVVMRRVKLSRNEFSRDFSK